MPSLIANNFCVWKSLPFLMYIVYSTTKSFALYPVSVLIVAAVPALAVNDPERLVVIPTFAFSIAVVTNAVVATLVVLFPAA